MNKDGALTGTTGNNLRANQCWALSLFKAELDQDCSNESVLMKDSTEYLFVLWSIWIMVQKVWVQPLQQAAGDRNPQQLSSESI